MARSDIKYLAEKMANAVITEVANNVQTEIEENAKEVIDNFYAEYNPSHYWRTHNLYRSYKPIKKRGQGYYRSRMSIDVGVEFSPNFILDNYDQPKDTVFSFAIGQGIHGGIQFINHSRFGSPVRKYQFEAPVVRMQKHMENIKPQQYVENAEKQAMDKYGEELKNLIARSIQGRS